MFETVRSRVVDDDREVPHREVAVVELAVAQAVVDDRLDHRRGSSPASARSACGEAASTASAIIRIPLTRVEGFGPGWRYSVSRTGDRSGPDFVSAFW